MPKVTINGVELEVPQGTNVVQAAEMAGQEIPHYCYHPGLSVAGNCRMCLVDIRALSEKQPNPLPKLQIGCNTTVQDGMVVESDNERVQEARRGVLELLLINHPIYCPVCDQAGECKLQEYYMDYGRHESRFDAEEKVRKGKAIPVGPDVMLDQERCILCTRCVRFLEEVTGTHELCVTERGDHSKLTLVTGKQVDNPYAANVVDICPVGALTSREFRFRSRVWYLDSTESICSACATGCNIDVHYRDGEIYRLKPRANAEVNGYWICDEGRHSYRRNRAEHRLRSSYARVGEQFQEVPFADAIERSVAALKECASVAIVASAGLSLEEAFLAGCIGERLAGVSLTLFAPPVPGFKGDEMLISEDRYPNRQGLLALGFSEDNGSEVRTKDGVLLLRCDAVGLDTEAWASTLENMDVTVVADDVVGKSSSYADCLLAMGSHFESDGCFVNRDGRVQKFTAAVSAPGQARPGWELLGAILSELGGRSYSSAEQVFSAAARKIALGDSVDYKWVGMVGR